MRDVARRSDPSAAKSSRRLSRRSMKPCKSCVAVLIMQTVCAWQAPDTDPVSSRLQSSCRIYRA